jgi:hypothetical protein
MDSELERQLERIENSIAEILAAVRKRLHEQRASSGDRSELHQRLRRFLDRKE